MDETTSQLVQQIVSELEQEQLKRIHKWDPEEVIRYIAHQMESFSQNFILMICSKCGLKEHDCLAESKTTVATIVDHRKPWQTGRTEAEKYRLFWDPSNHQSLCTTHHSRKTATEDGGCGNKRIG